MEVGAGLALGLGAEWGLDFLFFFFDMMVGSFLV